MDLFITLAIFLANAIALGIVYQFVKRLEVKEKFLFIAISTAIIYILLSIVYWFSGFGIEETIHEASKNFVIFVFVPVNVILFIPYMARQYMKKKENQMKQEQFLKKCFSVLLIGVVILVIEYFYFVNMQQRAQEANQSKNNIPQEEQNVVIEETNNTILVNEEINTNIINTNMVNTNSVNEVVSTKQTE